MRSIEKVLWTSTPEAHNLHLRDLMLIQITFSPPPQQFFVKPLKISEKILLVTCAFWLPTFSVIGLQQAPEHPPTIEDRNFTLI
jgi:hypothetical protein